MTGLICMVLSGVFRGSVEALCPAGRHAPTGMRRNAPRRRQMPEGRADGAALYRFFTRRKASQLRCLALLGPVHVSRDGAVSF